MAGEIDAKAAAINEYGKLMLSHKVRGVRVSPSLVSFAIDAARMGGEGGAVDSESPSLNVAQSIVIILPFVGFFFLIFLGHRLIFFVFPPSPIAAQKKQTTGVGRQGASAA